MRRFFTAVVGTMFVLTAGISMAQEEPKTVIGNFLGEKNINVDISATTDLYSKYIWRGMKLDNDFVIQPGFTIGAYGFELGVWSNFDIDAADGRASSEMDTSLTYTYDFENLNLFDKDLETFSVTVGHVYYDFPDAGTFSKEAVLGFSYDTFLAPSLTWYHDYSRESQGGGKGDYLVLDLSHSLDLVPSYGITLDLGGHVGYNRKLFIKGEGGDVALSGGVTIPLTKFLSMAPSINYSMPFGDVKDEGDGAHENEFFWGVGFSAEF
ncbi:MAG: TorF family putative porin [Candidatus Aceula meridiana]|nr:TorF family putative porin [Candidatus Aceula meridiana]